VNRKFVGLILERLGHQVTFAENGKQALDLASQNDFDIVLMDIHMPEMDGLTSTSHIRALPGGRGNVPIVALTADVMNEAEDRARAAGMDAFMSKPVNKQQLSEVMAHCVTHARRQREALRSARRTAAG
jgi:two-component system, sensor histidine kinase